MMNFKNKSTLLIVLIVVTLLVLSCTDKVEGSRILSEEHVQIQKYTSSSEMYEKAKFTMACWLQRLASGPSPRGPGH
ncbi:hypothetical protein CsatB_021374 [Cannabis sativa]|uniref:Uncharacterized protein n=1 Tax=Cannabis sativa TaxID=3483 RepID=A0A7J6HR97_CANSA|nr:hypothetical protein G4B88_007318 [Cannabis sativa]KAF4385843.1 hypothetical protein F8388_010399 [Cannabis sativa]KAF4397401.1 hypothetical protein G4B88_027141 [Cannabis sativa]